MKIRARSEWFKQHAPPGDAILGGGGPVQEATSPLIVHFSESNLSVEWDDQFESLLDLAEQHGMPINAGCRYGDCSTCQTQLLEGKVNYNHATGVRPDAGYCLPCSCRPLTSITLAA